MILGLLAIMVSIVFNTVCNEQEDLVIDIIMAVWVFNIITEGPLDFMVMWATVMLLWAISQFGVAYERKFNKKL